MLSKKALISAIFVCGSFAASAQNSSNSPYTRYGLGDLSDQIFTNNSAMGGIGYGLRRSNEINPMNPASYSSVDSLAFMFDMGISLKASNYKEKSYKTHTTNSSFDYLVMQFRLHPRLGLAFGFTPFSTVGYNFTVTDPVVGKEDVKVMNNFTGDGGSHNVFLGLGFKILENLSVGTNIGYFYGKQTYKTTAAFSDQADATINYNRRRIKSYKIDLGVQYTQNINENDNMTFGFTYGLGHDLNVSEYKGMQITDGERYNQVDEKVFHGGYSLPHSFGIGVAYKHKRKLTAGFDYTLQKWSKAKFDNKEGMYNDRTRLAFGLEYVPNIIGRNYLNKIAYRVGTYYTSPYLKTPQGDGPKEYGVSAGFGFPLYLFQRRTVLSITGQYSRLKPSVEHLLQEDRFVLKLGLTFNEAWFMKWRVN